MISPHSVFRYQAGSWESLEPTTIAEAPVSLTVNGQAWLTFLCTPRYQEALALGFLFNEGVIHGLDEVAEARLCEHDDNVDIWLTHAAEQPAHWRRTSGCSGGASAVVLSADLGMNRQAEAEDWKLDPEQVLRLAGLLRECQDQYRQTGGLHASALSDGIRILVSAEDIGRHNTLDKVAGLCLQGDIWPKHRLLLTTGRVSSEMLQKSARLGAGVLISRTAPTALAVELAERLGITLVGYARGERFTVYSHRARIEANNG
ncbi:MAG: formate dehydrogenase accessory sulfurtransferase FdhD [Anaerolineales bacterium]|nr:formate dehydrogenase accessory sulfurtransferase FdhD [Anaerolineales bacterium]